MINNKGIINNNYYINVDINDNVIYIKNNDNDKKLNNDNDNSKKLNQLLDISRIFGLILIVIAIYLSLATSKLTLFQLKLNNNFYIKSCDALGIPSSWKPYSDDNSARLPLYSTHNIDDVQSNITNAYIVQHGNLRNAMDYFCGAIDAINIGNDIDISMQTLIVSPIFLVDGDKCWGNDMNSYTVSTKDGVTCGYPIWSSEGWKDGHMALPCNNTAISLNFLPNAFNNLFINNAAMCKSAPSLHSYDVFNLLIKRLGDPAYFPNLKTITLFGFSAGGQTVLRYAILPQYQPLINNDVHVRFVVSDPSTYLYFDKKRPKPQIDSQENNQIHKTNNNGNNINNVNSNREQSMNINTPINGNIRNQFSIDLNYDFGIPNASWIPDSWRFDVNDTVWISGWNQQCENYNKWRYGLEGLQGYYKSIDEKDIQVIPSSILEFKNRDITYLIGSDDTDNCKLNYKPWCNDMELATYCEAMLQGNNRVDRALKYISYLNHYYKGDINHKLAFSNGIPHDPVKMLKSNTGKCIIFQIC